MTQLSAIEMTTLKTLAQNNRRTVLEMINNAESSHVGTCFSMAEILAVLYGKVLNASPDNPASLDRDRFILSKGHGAAAYYAILAQTGHMPKESLKTFYQNGSKLIGHVTATASPSIDVSTGSLGHGLSIGCGMSLNGLREGRKFRVFCVLSDGECDEGSTWEAVLFAGHQRLSNLVAIVDYNKIQSLGNVKDVLDLEPLADKWRAFNWNVKEVDGHDIRELYINLSQTSESAQPTCVIAHTVKGKGVSFMENKLLWHYRTPKDQEYLLASQELGTTK